MNISVKANERSKIDLENTEKYIKSENISQPAGAHFNKKAHSVSDIKGMVIEAVVSKDPFIRKERERQYIQKFKTFKKGLNQEP